MSMSTQVALSRCGPSLKRVGVPNKLASKCGAKQNLDNWKYLRCAQWRWEMDSTSLLAQTGQQLKGL